MNKKIKTLCAIFSIAACLGVTGCSTTPDNMPANDNEKTQDVLPSQLFKNPKFHDYVSNVSRYSALIKDENILSKGLIDGVRRELGDEHKNLTDRQIGKMIDDEAIAADQKEKMIVGAVKGVSARLSPHDSYMTAEEDDALWGGNLTIVGIGISYDADPKTGGLLIYDVEDTGPAGRAGIRIGDAIIAVNGQSITGMDSVAGGELIRGDKGTELSLTIKRMNVEKPILVSMTRNEVVFQSTVSRVIDNVAVIRLRDFSAIGTTRSVKRDIKKLTDQIGNDNIKGYILDLRNNGGGRVEEARLLIDAFVDKANAVSVEVKASTYRYEERTKPGDVLYGQKLVVLIDSGTASSAEIVAGSLKDHRRAIIMGTQSFGKGSVQSRIPLSRIWKGREDVMKITSALYFLPSGQSIQGSGVTPNVVVEGVVPMVKEYERDLENVAANPNGTDTKPETPDQSCAIRPLQDVAAEYRDFRDEPDGPLVCALDYINEETRYSLRRSLKPAPADTSFPAP